MNCGIKIRVGINKDGEWGYTLIYRSFIHEGAVFYETREEAQAQGRRAKVELLKSIYSHERQRQRQDK